ncbi:unnamed protein product [Mytilus coruscus]|uniref:Uncharacterized protein n=1 Tax=Mytilus coruscus TaxID=42192 RepID=A0A6J8A0K3_MYTCO|nr:unnamed protein product [Mytilus coruscus]
MYEMREYALELRDVFASSMLSHANPQGNSFIPDNIIAFIRSLIKCVADMVITQPGTYNPAKYGRAFYFSETGETLRSVRKFTIDGEKRKKKHMITHLFPMTTVRNIFPKLEFQQEQLLLGDVENKSINSSQNLIKRSTEEETNTTDIASKVRHDHLKEAQTSLCNHCFDGYPDTPTLKDATHVRRAKGILTQRWNLLLICQVGRKRWVLCQILGFDWYCHSYNKQRFIEMLSLKLQNCDYKMVNTLDDADVTIVLTAIQHAQNSPNNILQQKDIAQDQILSSNQRKRSRT